MARRENWLKAHAEDNNTAAVVRLSWAARGIWYALQIHTLERCDSPGVLTRRRRAIAIGDLALELHVQEDLLQEGIKELLDQDLLKKLEGDVLAFTDWNKRQCGIAVMRRDAWRASKRRQRAATRAATVDGQDDAVLHLRSVK